MRSTVPAALLTVLALVACSSEPAAQPGTAAEDPYAAAVSDPQEDSVYPEVGDPGVDALHYDLDLAWDPEGRELTATEVLTFRATTTADSFRLDLGEPLEVLDATLDGEPVDVAREGKDLVVDAPVEADARHELELDYAGTPGPVPAPTARADISTTGWHVTPNGGTWTMQEPYGAYSWYAVNDHPSDKALYDIAIEVPSPSIGVSNGRLVSRTEEAGTTRTEWHLDQPAASYLVTVATGRLETTQDTSRSGTLITYWTSPDLRANRLWNLRSAPRALDWLEERLGPYPFSTLGFVVVDGASGMETQTMITLGDDAYSTSPAVVLHELAHHWYGDQVGPDDWSEVWMNEGMAMYLQLLWESQHGGRPLQAVMDEIAAGDTASRAYAGPPADYDPDRFGDGNIYYLPALMWHELRADLGDDAFWSMVRAWPAARDDVATDREDYWAWLEEETGTELTAFLEAWLLGGTTPPVDASEG
ncbi:M1 family metallopeptidase [Nocardioides sp. AX2bis]|uniref:M1 family metallopeptidase n=1 Tax=Nocardioides sp. AX2bis TaxID=2653157 RepID=UPI0012F41756|nr:M1 family metallopeptidase [Nocardioides sp. AX2bis]VXB96607.1 Peptidase family M1 [Nocardioides sp. AX2bis]